jgi:hypothetical protein
MPTPRVKWAFLASAVLLILFGILQNPAPIGFESRPSSEVPSYFFGIFAIALILAVVAIPLGLWRMKRAVLVAAPAALFNLLPPIADQLHILHTAATPGAMLAVEALAVVDSLALLYLGLLGRK